MKTHSPAGTIVPPIDTSSVVNRSFAWLTGLVKRSSSSTAAGSGDQVRTQPGQLRRVGQQRQGAGGDQVDGGVEARHDQQEGSGDELGERQPVRRPGRGGSRFADDQRRQQVVGGLGPPGRDQPGEVSGQLLLHRRHLAGAS